MKQNRKKRKQPLQSIDGNNNQLTTNQQRRKRAKRKTNQDGFNLEKQENFEVSCFLKRHHHCWLREDGLDPTNEDDPL